MASKFDKMSRARLTMYSRMTFTSDDSSCHLRRLHMPFKSGYQPPAAPLVMLLVMLLVTSSLGQPNGPVLFDSKLGDEMCFWTDLRIASPLDATKHWNDCRVQATCTDPLTRQTSTITSSPLSSSSSCIFQPGAPTCEICMPACPQSTLATLMLNCPLGYNDTQQTWQQSLFPAAGCLTPILQVLHPAPSVSIVQVAMTTQDWSSGAAAGLWIWTSRPGSGGELVARMAQGFIDQVLWNTTDLNTIRYTIQDVVYTSCPAVAFVLSRPGGPLLPLCDESKTSSFRSALGALLAKLSQMDGVEWLLLMFLGIALSVLGGLITILGIERVDNSIPPIKFDKAYVLLTWLVVTLAVLNLTLVSSRLVLPMVVISFVLWLGLLAAWQAIASGFCCNAKPLRILFPSVNAQRRQRNSWRSTPSCSFFPWLFLQVRECAHENSVRVACIQKFPRAFSFWLRALAKPASNKKWMSRTMRPSPSPNSRRPRD